MLSEKCYPSVSLSVIIMFCLCSVDLRVELCCVRWSVCSTWLWHLKLGELQGSREYNEEDRRWFCSVYEVKLDVKVAIASFHAAASRLWVLVHWYAITHLNMVSWSSHLCTCEDDTGREAALQDSFGSIIYFYSKLRVRLRCLREILQLFLLLSMPRVFRPLINFPEFDLFSAWKSSGCHK